MPIEIDLDASLSAGSPDFCSILCKLVEGHGDIVDDWERPVISRLAEKQSVHIAANAPYVFDGLGGAALNYRAMASFPAQASL
jgi:hypothetical protein